MFLFISKKNNSEIENEKLILKLSKILDFYPNNFKSVWVSNSDIFIKWGDSSNTTSEIFENDKGIVLEEGLFTYKGDFSKNKFNSLMIDFSNDQNVIENLDGHFISLIHDKKAEETTFINDVIGLQHSFIYSNNECVVITSSLLLCSLFSESDYDYLAINEFISTGNIFEDRTLFKDIKRICEASLLKIKNGKIIKQKKYWNGLDEYKTNSMKNDKSLELIVDSLDSIIKQLKTFDGKIIADLTGGFDSRLILAFLLRNGIDAEFSVIGEKESKDVEIASKISNKLNLKLHFNSLDESKTTHLANKLKYLTFVTNGTMSIEPYIQSYIAHSSLDIKNQIHITGTGGELIRWDWPRYESFLAGFRNSVNTSLIVKSRFPSEKISRIYFKNELKNSLEQHFYNMVEDLSKKYISHKNVPKVDFIWMITRLQCWGGAFRSANTHINPIYTPFLTKKFLSVAFEVHYTLRRRNKIPRKILHTINEELSKIETEEGMPYQPLNFENFLLFFSCYMKKSRRISRLKNIFFSKNIRTFKDWSSDHLLFEWSSITDFRNIKDLSMFDFEPLEKNLISKIVQISYEEKVLLWRIITLDSFLGILREFRLLKNAY